MTKIWDLIPYNHDRAAIDKINRCGQIQHTGEQTMKKKNIAQSNVPTGNNINVNAKSAKPKTVNAKPKSPKNTNANSKNINAKQKPPKTPKTVDTTQQIANKFVEKIVLNDKWFATLQKYHPGWFTDMVIAIIANGFGTFNDWINTVIFPIAQSIREIDTIPIDKFAQNDSGTAKTIMLNYAGRLLSIAKLQIIASTFNDLGIDELSIDNVPHTKTQTVKISESDKLTFIESQLTKSRFVSYSAKIGKLTASDKKKSINRLYKSLID